MSRAKFPESSLVLIGAGGHAMVVAEAAALAGLTVVGVYDDSADAAACRVQRLRHLGALSKAADAPSFIVSLGDLPLRRRIIKKLNSGAARRVVHPRSIIHGSARVGPGVYIGPGTIVHAFAAIAAHAILNSGAIIEHECEIGENTHIAPGAVLGGRVRVGSDTLIGLGSRVLPNLTIGSGCTIGAGAVVTRDVPDGATVVGIPAKRRRR
jgi:acetyltransferase EpsM